jgi:hypothetical protein
MPTTTSLVLIFDELPPGLNGHEGLLRMHWTARRLLRERWHVLVRQALDSLPDITAQGEVYPFDKTHPCTILALRKDYRLMDWDNFGASLKPVLDGLVKCGMLADDGPAVVREMKLRQCRPEHGQKPHLRMWITAIPLEEA